MAKNYRQDDDIITVTAPEGGVKSGAGVVLGALFGIAGADAAEGELFAFGVRGVFELPAVATTIPQGTRVHWDADAAMVTSIADADTVPIGVAIGAGAAAGTVRVRLDGVALPVA
jgi:predicted RecA/RadA family phage recombinase